jgi:toxin ParE1/3/4
MSRIITFRLAAVKDSTDAFKWYEEQRLGLGGEYMLEIEAALARIKKNPEVPRLFYRQARKLKLKRFPFLVVYIVTPEEISIMAVFHCSRNPLILRRRLK